MAFFLPALSGKTPRQAATIPEGRERLELLLRNNVIKSEMPYLDDVLKELVHNDEKIQGEVERVEKMYNNKKNIYEVLIHIQQELRAVQYEPCSPEYQNSEEDFRANPRIEHQE